MSDPDINEVIALCKAHWSNWVANSFTHYHKAWQMQMGMTAIQRQKDEVQDWFHTAPVTQPRGIYSTEGSKFGF
jgi:hypothetical protein